MKPALVVVAMLAGTGCAGLQRSVDTRMILPPFAATQEVRKDQRFLMATPIEDASPAYPAKLHKTRQEKISVCIEIVVDADGNVAAAVPIAVLDECLAPVPDAHAPFVLASLEAVNAWSFFAAAICTITVDGGDCDGDSPDLRSVPSRMAYVFTFENLDGRPKVAAKRH